MSDAGMIHRSGGTPGNACGTRATRLEGFTLLELLTVIAIIGILAAITIPNLSAFKPNVMAGGTRQMLDDVARARQLAISRRTDVYMVFVPPGFWDTTYNNGRAEAQGADNFKNENLYEKQMSGYTYVSLRRLGDQPGAGVPEYLSEWRTLPKGVIIAPYKFWNFAPPQAPAVMNNNGERLNLFPFSVTNNIPFPSAGATNPPFANLPYIAFNYLGQLKSRDGALVAEDEFIPLALGSVGVGRDPDTRRAQKKVAVPQETPAGNSTNMYNIIRIDGLTGRARVERQEVR